MAIKQIDSKTFLEFRYVLGRDEAQYHARAFDKDGRTVAGPVAGATRADVETRIRDELKAISKRYFGPKDMVNSFLKIYPKGFSDPRYLDDEGNYKRELHTNVCKIIEKNVVDELISNESWDEAALRIKRAYQKPITPFLHMTELARVAEIADDPHRKENFVRHVAELLFSPDFDAAFDRFVHYLRPYNAAKWTIVTYLPFVIFPERHFFVKPTVTRAVAENLGEDLDYQAQPNAKIYRQILHIVDSVREAAAHLNPQDNIDIQSVFWAVERAERHPSRP